MRPQEHQNRRTIPPFHVEANEFADLILLDEDDANNDDDDNDDDEINELIDAAIYEHDNK